MRLPVRAVGQGRKPVYVVFTNLYLGQLLFVFVHNKHIWIRILVPVTI